MTQVILINLLLSLVVLWLCICIRYICLLIKERTKSSPKQRDDEKGNDHRKLDEQSSESYELVGKSKPFVVGETTRNIPKVPDASSSEKSDEKPDNFATAKLQEERQTVEADSSQKEENQGTVGASVDTENEMSVSYTMDEADEQEELREELLIVGDALPEVSSTAILMRDLQQLQRFAKHDEEVEETEVADIVVRMRGTDLMEQYTVCVAKMSGDHQKVLTAIRKAEEAETEANDSSDAPHSGWSEEDNNETTADDRPLSYYL